MFAEVSEVTTSVDHFVGWVLHMSHHILTAFLAAREPPIKS